MGRFTCSGYEICLRYHGKVYLFWIDMFEVPWEGLPVLDRYV